MIKLLRLLILLTLLDFRSNLLLTRRGLLDTSRNTSRT
uniref:p23 tumor protein-like protein n=1 Tax=Capsicum annuum TaxID=4072 RepID=Q6RVZ4_CAPAN|nr:P23 tumor protein-like protein [Capsicum annuum]